MYKLQINIYLIGVKNEWVDIAKTVETPDTIEANYIVTEKADKAKINSADYIIANLPIIEYKELIYDFRRYKKNSEAKLVICANQNEISELIDNIVISSNPADFVSISDFWPREMTKKQFFYYYSKWCYWCAIMELASSYKRTLDTIFKTSKDLIWIKEITEGLHLEFSDSFLEILPKASDGHRKTREECLNKGHLELWELSPIEYKAGDYICMESEQQVINSKSSIELDEKVLTAEGIKYLKTIKSPVYDKNGKLYATLGIAKDITNEKNYYDTLTKQLDIDFVTGLNTERYLYNLINTNDTKNISVLTLSLTNFNYLHDRYNDGREATALKYTAEMLKKHLPEYDAIRVNGDDFALIKIGDEDDAENRLIEDREKIKEILDSFFSNDKELNILIPQVKHVFKPSDDKDIKEFTNVIKSLTHRL